MRRYYRGNNFLFTAHILAVSGIVLFYFSVAIIQVLQRVLSGITAHPCAVEKAMIGWVGDKQAEKAKWARLMRPSLSTVEISAMGLGFSKSKKGQGQVGLIGCL